LDNLLSLNKTVSPRVQSKQSADLLEAITAKQAKFAHYSCFLGGGGAGGVLGTGFGNTG